MGIGYASQLAIDATTPKGISVLSPLSTENVGVTWNLHSKDATILLLGSRAVALLLERRPLRSSTDGWLSTVVARYRSRPLAAAASASEVGTGVGGETENRRR